MAEKITCENCGHTEIKGVIYCGKCGTFLPKETWKLKKQESETETTPNAEQPSGSSKESTTLSQQQQFPRKVRTGTIKTEARQKRKWYMPPERKRPAYHPFEWFFWICWVLYVILGFIWKAFLWLLKEFLKYLKWCVYWGPPDDL